MLTHLSSFVRHAGGDRARSAFSTSAPVFIVPGAAAGHVGGRRLYDLS